MQNKMELCCVFCSAAHEIRQCDEFRSLPLQSKITAAYLMGLCWKCLSNAHDFEMCQANNCYCGCAHHILLCQGMVQLLDNRERNKVHRIFRRYP